MEGIQGMKIVGKSKETHIQTVGKCLNQYQVTLTFNEPVDNKPLTELTDYVRSYLPCYPSISSLYVQADPTMVSVVYVMDSSD